MPFKSKSQRRKFYAMEEKGEISQSIINEFEKKTPKNIPEKVKPKKGGGKKKK